MRMIKYVPNILTLLRLAATPVMIAAFLQQEYKTVFTIFILASLTDGLDGFIARRFNARTELGAILDPIADKVMVLSIFYLLHNVGLVPTWLWLLVVFRDFCIVGYSVAMRYLETPVTISPSYLSKFNTFVQFLYLTLLLGYLAYDAELLQYAQPMQWLIAVTTFISGLHYFWAWVIKPQTE